MKTISFPAISAGIYGFPKDLCARILLEGVKAYFEKNPKSQIGTIRFVLFDEGTADTFVSVFDDLAKNGIL